MRGTQGRVRPQTETSLLPAKDATDLPLAFNVSATNYCSLRVKKKLIDRYLSSKQVSQNCRHHKAELVGRALAQSTCGNTQTSSGRNPFEVSPIKIHENSPQLIRQRIKTEYPRGLRQCRQKLKSAFKAITVDFLQQQTPLPPKAKFKVTKLPSASRPADRPLTSNDDLRGSNRPAVRRTKTLDISSLVRSANGVYESYAIRGWEQEVPQHQR